MKQFDSPPDIHMTEPLSTREREILALMAERRSNKEIASSLHLALSTVKWYTRQIFGKLGVENRRAAVEQAVVLHLIGEDHRTSIPQNLPVASTPFIGRGTEIEEIIGLLTAPEPRLVTLLGPGGSGKTRLAVQAAASLVEKDSTAFSNGIWFVSLAPLQNSESILQTIASAVGFVFYDRGREPLQQLLDFLRQRHLLLVLDNFEHLLSAESAHLVTEILLHVPHVKMLVTSRSRLNVQGEQLFRVAGMKTPREENLIEAGWNTFSAIQLFVESARRVQPKFEINQENSASILRICQLVEGMPLGIEMATAWLELLSPQEIETEIRHGFDFLQAQGTEERHQSLRVVFNTSWKLLSLEEQNALMALTVFQGNFTREAAQHVSETSLNKLLALVNKSWLTKDINGRYHIHELLRQYAHEKLRSNPFTWEKAKTAHAHHFAALMQDLGEQMKGPGQVEAFQLTELEFENVRAAWVWLTEQEQFSLLIERMLLALTLYGEARWRTEDTLLLIRHTQEKLDGSLSNKHTVIDKAALTLAELAFDNEFHSLRQIADFELMWGNALPLEKVTFAWKALSEKFPKDVNGFWLILSAEFIARHGQSQLSIRRLVELKRLFAENHDVWLRGVASQSLARVLNWFGTTQPQIDSTENQTKHNKVTSLLQEALHDFQTTGDRWKQGNTLRMLASLESNPAKELSLLQQAKGLLETVGDITTSALILHALAEVSKRRGKYEEVFPYFHEEQKIFEELGNQGLLANAFAWESIEALRFSTIPHARQARNAYMAILRKDMAILRKELGTEYALGSRNPDTWEAMYAWGLWELGEIERVAGNFEKARQNYEEANQLFELINLGTGMAFYHRGVGDLSQNQGDYETARRHFQFSVEFSQSGAHAWMEVCALCGLGRADIGLEQYESAQENFVKALRISRQLENLELCMMAFAGLASLHVVDGNRERAIELGSFVLQHFASWNEVKQQVRVVVEAASRQLPAKIVEAAKERGKNFVLEDIFKKYLTDE